MSEEMKTMEEMIQEHFEAMSVGTLKDIACQLDVSTLTAWRKQEIVDAIIETKKAEAEKAVGDGRDDKLAAITESDVLTWVCINLELITEEPKPQYVIDHEEKIAELKICVADASVEWACDLAKAKSAKKTYEALTESLIEAINTIPQPALFDDISDDKKDAARKQGEEAMETCSECGGLGHKDGVECKFCESGKIPQPTGPIAADHEPEDD